MIPPPSFTMIGADVLALAQPFVYGWRRGSQHLYVGATRRGLPRVLDPGHVGFAAGHGMRADDCLDLWPAPQGTPVFALENILIRALGPTLNGDAPALARKWHQERFEKLLERMRQGGPFRTRRIGGIGTEVFVTHEGGRFRVVGPVPDDEPCR